MSNSNIKLQLEDDGISNGSSTWRIPRPSIHSSSTSSSSSMVLAHTQPMAALLVPALTQYQQNLHLSAPDNLKTEKEANKWSSQSTSCSSLTEGSHSLLLAPCRLEQDQDTVSIASSMHFTIVNGMRPARSSQGCCRGSYQLPILVITMTFIIFLGILAGVLFIQRPILPSMANFIPWYVARETPIESSLLVDFPSYVPQDKLTMDGRTGP